MSEDNTPRPQQPSYEQRPAEPVEKSVREGTWQVIQQGAEVYGALGGGIAAFTTGGKLIKDTFFNGPKNDGGSSTPQNPQPGGES